MSIEEKLSREEKLHLERNSYLTESALKSYMNQMPPDWRAYANLCVALQLREIGLEAYI